MFLVFPGEEALQKDFQQENGRFKQIQSCVISEWELANIKCFPVCQYVYLHGQPSCCRKNVCNINSRNYEGYECSFPEVFCGTLFTATIYVKLIR